MHQDRFIEIEKELARRSQVRNGRSITRGQALALIVKDVGTSVQKPFQLGDYNQVIGRGAGADGRWARFSLLAVSEMSTYDTLEIEAFEGKKCITTYRLKLTDKEYESAEKSNPDLDQGGYFWAHDGQFYNWMPDTLKIARKVDQILKFHGVLR